MFVNGFAILNNERFLEKCAPAHGQPTSIHESCTMRAACEFSFISMYADGWGFSQMGAGDGNGSGHSAFKSQIVGFLFAAAYMRGSYQLQALCSSRSNGAKLIARDVFDSVGHTTRLLMFHSVNNSC